MTLMATITRDEIYDKVRTVLVDALAWMKMRLSRMRSL